MTYKSLLILLVFAGANDPDRPIVVSDANRFSHYSADEARRNYRAALAHWQFIKDSPLYHEFWKEDAFWCYDCWNELDNLKNFSVSDERKINILYKLRSLLGQKLWQEGRMPPPLPFWWFYEIQ